MIKNKLILFVIIIAIILLTLFLDQFITNVIASYLVIFIGITLYFFSYKNQNLLGIFMGSFVFFSGIIMYVIASFVFWNVQRMIFPAFILSAALSSLLTYYNFKRKIFIIFSLALLLLGFNILIERMNFKFDVFLNALLEMILNVGLFVVLLIAILYLLIREKLESEDKIVNDYLKEKDDDNKLKYL